MEDNQIDKGKQSKNKSDEAKDWGDDKDKESLIDRE